MRNLCRNLYRTLVNLFRLWESRNLNVYMYMCAQLYLVPIPYDSKSVCHRCTCNNCICVYSCSCTCICICICICICTCNRLLLLYDSCHDIREHYRRHHNKYCSYHFARSTQAQQVSAIPSPRKLRSATQNEPPSPQAGALAQAG